MIMIGRTLHCHVWAPEEVRHASACQCIANCHGSKVGFAPDLTMVTLSRVWKSKIPNKIVWWTFWGNPGHSCFSFSPGFHFFYFILKLLFQQASMDRRTHPAPFDYHQTSQAAQPCDILRSIVAMAPKQGSGSKEFCKKFLCPGSPGGLL